MLLGALYSVADLLWPERCVGCDRLGTLLCDACAADLPTIDQRWVCPQCGAPFGWLLCTECLGRWEEGTRVVSALGFEGVAARLITVYKDEHERRLAPLLATFIAQALREAQTQANVQVRAPVDALTEKVPLEAGGSALAKGVSGEILGVDAVTFIPSTASAFTRRGFDPMLGVARELGRLLGLPVADELVHHDTQDQRELNREERWANVQGSFEVARDVWGAKLLLIDDVITTGASLRAAIQALVERGARVPWAASVARVW